MKLAKSQYLTVIITALSRGGAEIQLLYLTRELRNKFERIDIIFFDEEPSSGTLIHEFNQIPNVFLHKCVFSPFRPIQTTIDLSRQFSRIINIPETSYIYTLMVRSDLYGKILKTLLGSGVKLTQSFHAAYDIAAHKTVSVKIAWFFMFMWGYRGVNPKIFISRSVKKAVTLRYPFISSHHGEIIHYGLPDQLFQQDTIKNKDLDIKGKPFILMVGRLDPDKNYNEAIAIYKILRGLVKKDCPRLVIIGQDDYKLQNKILSEVDGVEYLGPLPNNVVLSYMKKADLFLFCSLNEGLGLALLEALSQECIVLARNSGAFPELLQHRQNGFLYNGSNLEEAASLILEILSLSNDERYRIITNAKERLMSRHSIKSYAKSVTYAIQGT